MRPPIANRDPGDEQATLFADPPKCRANGCPGVKNLCVFDADVSEGIRDPYSRRPATCLNTGQLGPHDPLPY